MAREELDWWAGGWGRELGNGIFGENLTITELDVDGAVVGERWVIGDVDGAVVLEVTGPRIPCRTFAGHMGERGWVRRFTERGRTGAYLAVVTPGVIEAGMGVRVVDRPDHGLTVPEAFRAQMGDRTWRPVCSRPTPCRSPSAPRWPPRPADACLSPTRRATAPPRALTPTQSVCLSAPQHGQTHTERAGPGAGRDEAPVRDRGLGCSGRCRVLSRRGGRGRCDA